MGVGERFVEVCGGEGGLMAMRDNPGCVVLERGKLV